MPIDAEKARGAQLPDQPLAWGPDDVMLYHLGIGAGQRPSDLTDAAALRYTLDYPDADNLQVLPSFGIVAPMLASTEPPTLDLPGCDIDLAQVLHGSQAIRVRRPLPPRGTGVLRTRISEVWDKGKAAVIVQEATAVSETGEEMWTATSSIFVRGEGGWGGERGPSTAVPVPERAPDRVVDFATSPAQALLYRLSGDRNPLHADPGFAAGAGFPAPILHGLCSWGIVLREVTDALLDSDASRVAGYSARFAGVVFPGETIRIQMWDDTDRVVVRAAIAAPATPERDGSPVLADCEVQKAES
ncbi:MaoC/PaaZ C-terminal domain-containing protein [Nocardioides sp. Kera G14]|uniref:MaoC/PaaZ C-terminal domain-containing protein n=1 Tax=Nocardioides sp. Kera G14 TaxID=2884264 RepID=UPI001D129ABA|nr:MaoC/PaaZ C-terminal domain-containing protein [Nocardioides sp. Kera G14]UDY22280.1 3-alpha,7-alpha,12-alpha-trihydroxy-5-beta-cholest-24-enoyl-CoA hydratase [Nocardioides sp. Kera G14]